MVWTNPDDNTSHSFYHTSEGESSKARLKGSYGCFILGSKKGRAGTADSLTLASFLFALATDDPV